jgi:hypothetical protein
MFEEAKATGVLTGYGLAYVELSWARACVMLAVDRGDFVERILQRLASNAVLDSVRWSALRWLGSYYALTGRRAESQEQVEQLQHEGGNAARTPFLLAQLDEAIATGSKPAPGLMDELRSLQPGVIGHLLQVAPAGSEAQYVARFYPY